MNNGGQNLTDRAHQRQAHTRQGWVWRAIPLISPRATTFCPGGQAWHARPVVQYPVALQGSAWLGLRQIGRDATSPSVRDGRRSITVQGLVLGRE